MWLDRLERWVRWAGAVGALLFVGAMTVGLWRGFRHPKGRTIGPMPAFVQASSRGSPAFYLPATLLGFGLMYLLWRPIRLALSPAARAVALILGALLYFPGLGLMLWGRLALGEMYNVSTTVGVQLYADHRLVTSGPYSLMRHPMYVGGQLAELGALLIYRTWATLLVAAINIPVLWLRARREEQALASEFGEEWEEYSRRVPAWIPHIAR